MTALLLGSISTLADTSERQREAFNEAFAAHDLDWTWEPDEYRSMLSTAGGRDRIATYAQSQGVAIDADAVHATKSELFQEKLATSDVEARPGVVETVRAARDAGEPVALVTTTSGANVDALLAGLAPQLDRDDFDVVITRDDVADTKPHPSAYETALARLGITADQAVAVEDNVDGVTAAKAAGLRCIALPNENTAGHDFDEADTVTDALDPSILS